MALCRLLLSFNAKIDKSDSFGSTALHWASNLNFVEIAKLLVESQANPFLVDHNNQTPMELAILNGNIEIAILLKDECVLSEKYRKYLITSIEVLNPHIFNILMNQIKLGRVEHNLNFIDDRVGSLLHYAVILNPSSNNKTKTNIDEKVYIIETLIDNGIEINLANRFGETPLHVCRDIEVARLLLNKGANMNLCEITGKIPLYNFILRANYDICVEMIKCGCKVDTMDRLGNSLLYTIINSNAPLKIILLLLEAGIDLNEIWLKRKEYPRKMIQKHPSLVDFIEWKRRNPPSLKELARKSLRLHLNIINSSKSIIKSVNKLEKMIPSSLQDYVLFNFNSFDNYTIK